MKPLHILALMLSSFGFPHGSSAAQPNVLIVIADDASWLEYSAYGWTNLQTPNFDRVAKQGALFTHGYTSAPSCAPSRASLLTGRNFWELEQGAFIQAWVPKKFPCLPELMSAGGYHTGYTGKGWGPGEPEPNAPKRDLAGPVYKNLHDKNAEPGMSDCDYAGNFTQFLSRRKKGQPFCFWAGLLEPHGPWGKDNHTKLGMDLKDISFPKFLPDTDGVRHVRAGYLYEVRHADETLGKLLKILENQGELDNTLVIVTADNGTPVMRAKADPYDWGLRVPLAMMWPAKMKAGRRVEDFVSFPDLTPTILAAAGLPIPESMSGRSALNVLLSPESGRVDPTRSFFVGGLEWHGELPPVNRAARIIRDHRYAYIVNYSDAPHAASFPPERQLSDSEFTAYAAANDLSSILLRFPNHPQIKPFIPLIAAPRPHEELYDCEADPWQMHNVATDPEHAVTKEKLRVQLEAYQRQTQDPRITRDMKVFEETRAFVIDRKAKGYSKE